jgi:hypothetical protein
VQEAAAPKDTTPICVNLPSDSFSTNGPPLSPYKIHRRVRFSSKPGLFQFTLQMDFDGSAVVQMVEEITVVLP